MLRARKDSRHQARRTTAFMGRYSRLLAAPFADAIGVVAGQKVLDVGCGPGALTGVLVDRVGADSVSACDPSVPFVPRARPAIPASMSASRRPRRSRSTTTPSTSSCRNSSCISSAIRLQAAAELRRVLRPGGIAGACVWEFGTGMVMLRQFWDAALAVDPGAPDEQGLAFGGPGEIADLFETSGFVDIVESTLTVNMTYTGFDELWSGLLLGIGPAGAYLVSLPEDHTRSGTTTRCSRVSAPRPEHSPSTHQRGTPTAARPHA